jgi:vacuolar-type H+-ATPase subunit C/Vma6
MGLVRLAFVLAQVLTVRRWVIQNVRFLLRGRLLNAIDNHTSKQQISAHTYTLNII